MSLQTNSITSKTPESTLPSKAKASPPLQMISQNRGFLEIIDPTIDRRSEKAICNLLAEKYNLQNVHVLNMKEYTASTIVTHKN